MDQFIDVNIPMDLSRLLPDTRLDVSLSSSSSTSSLNNCPILLQSDGKKEIVDEYKEPVLRDG